jgi:PAS domain S-box-containing protein
MVSRSSSSDPVPPLASRRRLAAAIDRPLLARRRGDELARIPSSLEDLVRSSDVPLVVLDLESETILLGNDQAAGVLGVKTESLPGNSAFDFVAPEQRPQAEAALRALAVGALIGYQAVRGFGPSGSATRNMGIWVNALNANGTRFGLVSFASVDGASAPFKPITALAGAPVPGQMVLGTVDSDWRINGVSQDIEQMLGFTTEELRGAPVLGAIHPEDVTSFLAAVEHARVGHRTVWVGSRLRAKSGEWRPVAAVLAALTETVPPALAFAFVSSGARDAEGSAVGDGELSRLEGDLLRIATDLRACGTVTRMRREPDPTQFPVLSRLTTREWEILVRLLNGERVPSIASDLFVSPSTVRHHLSSIFSKFEVHSQAELIRHLRPH